MNSKQLIEAIAQYAASKNIDKPTVAKIINEVFSALILKEFGTTEGFSIVVNPQEGDLQIFQTKKIVADGSLVAHEPGKIVLTEARKIEPDFEIGEEIDQEIPLSIFKLRAQRKALQVFQQKTKEIEDYNLYQKYVRRVGEILTVEVRHQTPTCTIMYDEEKNELLLPHKEKIPKDKFYIGEEIQALLTKVEKREKGMTILLSRTSPLFLEKLFYKEIPEIKEGIVKIHKVVRRPGERAKIAVSSQDDRIDPVGALVGLKGTRISSVREQVCYEPIDIVHYTDNQDLYIKRALAPAKIKSISYKNHHVDAYLDDDQMPLAIGTKGQNINLACQLTGHSINLHPSQVTPMQYTEDVALEEFADEIAPEILAAWQEIGLQTGKSVLALTLEDLQEKTALPIKNLKQAYEVIQKEFQK